MNKIILNPGFLKSGKRCKNCIKSLEKTGNYCKRIEHSKVRYIEKKSNVRKNVEYNFAEAIVAVCFKYPQVKDINDIVEKIEDIQCVNKEGYIEDLLSRCEKRVNKYIKYVNQFREKFGLVKEAYLLGKTYKSFPEICELNKGLNQIECKSDVMLKMEDNSWIGISVKSQKDAFLTNYSIQKILSNGKELSKIKKEMLKEKGFEKFNSEERDLVNPLFYPGVQNIYWDKLAESIEREKDIIISKLTKGLCSTKTPYQVYEIDGEKIVNLSELYDEFKNGEIEMRKIEYPNRQAAKMWYQVLVNEKIKFKFEIRWKGDVFVSPQIITQRVY